MTRFTSKLLLALTLLSVTGLVAEANATDFLRINREAQTIERKANLLIREVNHYRKTPEFRYLVADVEQFIYLSQEITDLVARTDSITTIRLKVNKLDRTFCHLESLFDEIEYAVSVGRRVKIGNTAHVKRLLNDIEICIHHMQEDVLTIESRVRQAELARTAARYGQSNRGRSYAPAPRVVVNKPYNSNRSSSRSYNRSYNYRAPAKPIYNQRPTYKPNRNARGGVGLTIGGGSSKIHIRF